MAKDLLTDLAERVSRIETFLDAYWRERQHLASLRDPFSHGSGDWRHGVPIGGDPVGFHGLSSEQIPLGHAAASEGINKADAVQAVRFEPRD